MKLFPATRHLGYYENDNGYNGDYNEDTHAYTCFENIANHLAAAKCKQK